MKAPENRASLPGGAPQGRTALATRLGPSWPPASPGRKCTGNRAPARRAGAAYARGAVHVDTVTEKILPK